MLYNAVFVQSELDTEKEMAALLRDVEVAGANARHYGFTYDDECVKFVVRHRETIFTALEELGEETGEYPEDIVMGFKQPTGYTPKEVKQVLYCTANREHEGHVLVAVALAWFSLEHVAWVVGNEAITRSTGGYDA
jgi:hypothetical protein